MGIETSVADKKVKPFRELSKDKNQVGLNPNPNSNSKTNTSNKGKKNRRRNQRKMVDVKPVQKLYDTCNDVFASCGPDIIPSSDNIEKIKAILDDFKPGDVGLSPEMSYFRATVAGSTPVIRYVHIYECDKFSMGIFCLPPSCVIPLHNHPGMTVFSKLLFGTMHIKSYDWVVDVPCNTSAANPSKEKQPEGQQSELGQPKVQQPKVRLAKVKVNSDFTAPCNTSILYPADGGNMHCFTAVTACAFLDVLGPPYSDADGRHCEYYFEFPFADFSVEGLSVPEEQRESYAWLQERGGYPEDLTVVGGRYEGPPIVEK